MSFSLRNVSLAGMALAAVLTASTVKADISIEYGNDPQPNQENVLFNDKGGQVPLLNDGPIIQGRTNQTDTLVDFFGAGEDLTAPSSGQARVEAVDGLFDKICIAYNDPNKGFASIILNINAEDYDTRTKGGYVNDGTVKFTVYRTDGTTYEQTLDLDDNGQNFFTIVAFNNQCIQKLCLDVYNTAIKDIRQVRVSECPAVIPLPAAAWMGLSLLGAVGARHWRKRREMAGK